MSCREDGLDVDAHAALGAVLAPDYREAEGLLARSLLEPDGQDGELLTVARVVAGQGAELGCC